MGHLLPVSRHAAMSRLIQGATIACFAVALAAAAGTPQPHAPLGLDGYMPVREENPLTTEKIEPGRRLFNDRRLPFKLRCASGVSRLQEPADGFDEQVEVAEVVLQHAVDPMAIDLQVLTNLGDRRLDDVSINHRCAPREHAF